jgi:hypothetical protein
MPIPSACASSLTPYFPLPPYISHNYNQQDKVNDTIAARAAGLTAAQGLGAYSAGGSQKPQRGPGARASPALRVASFTPRNSASATYQAS